jgi:transketolase
MDNAAWRVYCLMSDAELECGQTWEAFLFAARNKLSNCTFVIDRNSIQIDGTTEDIMPLEPIAAKLKAFNLNVERCVGNSIKDFIAAIGRARYVTDKPTAIIADTIPGFGVKFMEGDYKWHGKTLSPGKEACEAIKNIRAGKNNQ